MPLGSKDLKGKESIKPKIPEAYPTQHDPLTKETALPVRERFDQFVIPSTQTAIRTFARGLQGEQWRSLRVSNLTAQWLYVRQAHDFVPPGTWNAILPLTGANVVEAAFIAPLGITQPAQSGANPDGALCWVSENEWQPTPGTVVSLTGGGLAADVQGFFADETTASPNPVVIGAMNSGVVEALQTDGNDALLVAQETTEPWDDGPATHTAAAFPGTFTCTPNGSTVTVNMLTANVNGNNFLSPNAPPAGLTVQGFPSMLDVRHIRLYIDNATAQSVTAVTISTAQTTGSTTETITYTPTVFANITTNTGAALHIPTPRGLYPTTVNLQLANTANSGTITVQAWFYTQPMTSGSVTDRSGTTSGTPSTSTQVVAANPARRFFLLQNNSSNPLWYNFTTAAAATQPSILLAVGATHVYSAGDFIPTEAINILSAVASQAFTAKEA